MTVEEGRVDRNDLVPLSDRLAVLLIARLAIAAAVMIAVGLLGWLVGDPSDEVFFAAVVYAGLTTAVEWVRRRLEWRGMLVVSALLVIDGIFLAYVVAQTGGAASLLSFLIYFHIVAVTLVASYRTGLKVAVWHALLMVGSSAAIVSYYLNTEPAPGPNEATAFRATGLLVLAIGAAAFSSLNERGLNHSRRQTQAQLDLSSELEQAHRPEQICGYLARHVCTRMGFQRAVALAAVGDRSLGALEDAGGTVLVDAPAMDAHPAGVVRECWVGHEPALVQSFEPESDEFLDRLLPFGRNLVVVPLLADGKPVGILAAEWAGGRWSRMPTSTLTALIQSASHAGMSLRTIMLMAEVERLARHDRLTGLSNRHEFDEVLPKEFSRAQRTSSPLGLVLFDIDQFKAVNDTHGHQVGDEVLRQVGFVLRDLVRQEDVAARFGGEEFVVLLPGIDAEGTLTMAERLRAEVADRVDAVPITASAGVACYPDHATSIDELIGQADAALYQAKRAGRDRTVLCPERITSVAASA